MPRDPGRTRRAILAAALREFARVGPAGARVDRIAAEAGVNKRMLYHYFGNKAGLYQALLADHERPLAEASAHVSGRLAALDAGFSGSSEWVRLLMWAELDGTRPLESRTRHSTRRRRSSSSRCRRLRSHRGPFRGLQRQLPGSIPRVPSLPRDELRSSRPSIACLPARRSRACGSSRTSLAANGGRSTRRA